MSAYKDKTQGTWYVSFRYIDWTGKKTQKLKRGFKTKKEALNYEKEFIRKTAADMKMEMNSFIQVYFEDKKNELKENSIRNKQHMMNKHIVPYFGTRKMNEITPAEIIQWQNAIQEKGYSKTYERMIQNQLNALFNHAQKIYNLKENPCKKVKKMGKSDANKLEFWTKAEYDRFIAGIEPGSEDYLIFEILFWTGIREGELLALSLSDFDMPWREIGDALQDIKYDGNVVMEPFVRMGGQVGSDIKIWRDISRGASEAELDADAKRSVEFQRYMLDWK